MEMSFPKIAGYFYDSLYIIMQTYENAGKSLEQTPTADEFREYLYKNRYYSGVTGKMYLEDTGVFESSKLYLKQIVDGKLILIEE